MFDSEPERAALERAVEQRRRAEPVYNGDLPALMRVIRFFHSRGGDWCFFEIVR
jgi:hypothetical protein